MNFYELYYYFLNNIDQKLQQEMITWLKKRNHNQNDLITLHELYKRIVNQYPFLNDIDYNTRFKTLKENLNNENFQPENEPEKKFIHLFKNNQNDNILHSLEYMNNRTERDYYLKLYFVKNFEIQKSLIYKQIVVLFDQFRDEILKNNHKHNFIVFKYVDQELKNIDRATLFTNYRNRPNPYIRKDTNKNNSFKINIK